VKCLVVTLVEVAKCGILVYCLLFSDEQHGRLFITFNSELLLLELKHEMKDRVISHDASLVGAFYNHTYNHVSCRQAQLNVVDRV